MSICRMTKVILLISLIFIDGCTEKLSSFFQNNKTISKDVNIQFSSNIFLNGSSKKDIFIQIKNLACPQFTNKIKNDIYTGFKYNAFNIVDEPIDAQFLLQVNIIRCSSSDNITIAQYYIEQGYGTSIDDKKFSVKDEGFVSIIADLQISERSKEIPNIKSFNIKLWDQYQTRLAITNKNKNKNFNDLIKFLIKEFSKSIMSVFVT